MHNEPEVNLCHLAVHSGVSLLSFFLFFRNLARIAASVIDIIMRELTAVCRDETCCWMLFACLLVYLGIFLFLEFKENKGYHLKISPLMSCEAAGALPVRSSHAASMLLIGLVVLFLFGYTGNYPLRASSLQILKLLAGIVVGKALAAWVNFASSCSETSGSRPIRRLVAVLTMIVGLLSVAALYQPNSGLTYAYHDIRRWTGPWDNPNLFGLLMGAGVVLAVGLGLGRWRIEDGRLQIANKNLKRKYWKCLFMMLCLIAVILLGRGLYHSLSRGAWLGTAVGLVYLLFNYAHLTPTLSPRRTGGEGEANLSHSCVSWLKQNRLPVIAITLSVFVVCFWQLRFSKFQSAQRIASVANPNDFSWRNRLSAWQGAVRMMVDKPLTGFGWGEAESVYAKQYCTTAANESAAIQMNDYLMLGISGGVPVMLCFIGYVALCYRRKHPRLRFVSSMAPSSQPSPPAGEKVSAERLRETSAWDWSLVTEVESLQAVCRAGVIVLLVGFWFDGGLFKLPSAVVFWILLELSRLEFIAPQTASASAAVEQSLRPANYGKSNRWLSRVAWCAVIAAVAVSSFYLFAPYLPVSAKTIAIARHYLILPRERADFDFLAAKPLWQGQTLKTLLDQAELANYNRELINWQLDETNYRNYVLSPVIEPSSILHPLSSSLNWRRPLWKSFYPLIRHENLPADAAQTVVQQLRKRIPIVAATNVVHDITAIWQQRTADKAGFQMICVAALRSVGVPARLEASGQAVFYDGNQWRPALRSAFASSFLGAGN